MLIFLLRWAPYLIPLLLVGYAGHDITQRYYRGQIQALEAEHGKAIAEQKAKRAEDDLQAYVAQVGLQGQIEAIAYDTQAKLAAADRSWRAVTDSLRRQAAQTGCVVPASSVAVPDGAAHGDGLADGAGNADRLVDLFREADRNTQKLIGLQAAWSLMTKMGQCPSRESPAGP